MFSTHVPTSVVVGGGGSWTVATKLFHVAGDEAFWNIPDVVGS